MRVSVGASCLLLAAFACGGVLPAGAANTEMIVGGTEVPPDKYPWQVRIYDNMRDQYGYCGGSIIAPQWVLTAAHCVVDTTHAVIGYGSVDRTQTTKVESEMIIVHPDYVAGKKADVALIKLKEPVDPKLAIGIADANVDKALLPPGASVTVSGWGATWDNQIFAGYMDYISKRKSMKSETELNFPLKLAEVEIKVIDQNECKKAYEALNFTEWSIGDTEICATEPSGGKDSCYGDSGGPLIVADDSPQGQVLVGLVSWGPQCGNPTVPGVYTRVSSFNKWVNAQMKGN